MKAQYLIPALLLLCGTLLASAIAGPRGIIEDRETLETELKAAFAREDTFTILACRIEKRAYDGRL